MDPHCGNCLFNNDELTDWYGCIWGDGTGGGSSKICIYWIPNDKAMAQIEDERKNWRKIYKARQKYNEEVPEEQRLSINREGEVIR
jgi:hypothetical protein